MKKVVARQSLVAFVAILLAALVTPIIRHITQPAKRLPVDTFSLYRNGAPHHDNAIVLRERP